MKAPRIKGKKEKKIFRFCFLLQDMNPLSLATPNIDAALDLFKQRGATTPEISTSASAVVTSATDVDTSQRESPGGAKAGRSPRQVRLAGYPLECLRLPNSGLGVHLPNARLESPSFGTRHLEITQRHRTLKICFFVGLSVQNGVLTLCSPCIFSERNNFRKQDAACQQTSCKERCVYHCV